jgi:glycosyltransferase involved in cell wall biosynthesis
MRLLFLQETDWLRRYPAQQHHLAEMMSLRGHEIRAIDYELLWRAQDRQGLYAKRQVFDHVTKIHQGASITVIRPGFIRLPLLDYVSMLSSHRKEIERQIKEYQPDAIIGLGILNSYMAARAVRGTRIPFIYYWIDILHLLIPAKPFRILGKWVESAALKRADRILTINDRLKDFVLGMGAPDGRTHVLRAGIDTQQFNQSVDGNAIRKQYGLSGEDIVLFFMGWLYQFSGLREVARQLAANRNNSLKLLIVGEGDTYEELKAIREKHNLQDKLLLAGQKPYHEIPKFIAAADICLLPAYPHEPVMQDIVPIKLYEYMAMKKPVIATRLPGVMREFGDDNGLLYVDRPEDVVGKAIQLAANGNINELGAKARSFAEKNSWEKITSEFEKLLEEVIKEKQNGQLSKGI